MQISGKPCGEQGNEDKRIFGPLVRAHRLEQRAWARRSGAQLRDMGELRIIPDAEAVARRCPKRHICAAVADIVKRCIADMRPDRGKLVASFEIVCGSASHRLIKTTEMRGNRLNVHRVARTGENDMTAFGACSIDDRLHLGTDGHQSRINRVSHGHARFGDRAPLRQPADQPQRLHRSLSSIADK